MFCDLLFIVEKVFFDGEEFGWVGVVFLGGLECDFGVEVENVEFVVFVLYDDCVVG